MTQPQTAPVALVTGASRGIGEAIAQALSDAGYELLLTARSEDLLKGVSARLHARSGRRAHVLAADLREPESAGILVRGALSELSRIDLLVNVAGATRRGSFLELTEADWQDGFALKFFGAVRLSREAWPHLRSARGQVINIIGSGGRTPTAEFTIGGSVNSALMNFTKALADLGLKEGVRVNALNPGPIRTGRLEARLAQVAQARGIDAAEAEAQLVSEQKVIRFGSPEEIADTVVFLAAGGGSYFHGAILDVDGGATKGL